MKNDIPPLEQGILASLAGLFKESDKALEKLEKAFRDRNKRLTTLTSLKDKAPVRVCREFAKSLRGYAGEVKSKGASPLSLDILKHLLEENRFGISTASPTGNSNTTIASWIDAQYEGRPVSG